MRYIHIIVIYLCTQTCQIVVCHELNRLICKILKDVKFSIIIDVT